jgi:hypothetical protein
MPLVQVVIEAADDGMLKLKKCAKRFGSLSDLVAYYSGR